MLKKFTLLVLLFTTLQTFSQGKPDCSKVDKTNFKDYLVRSVYNSIFCVLSTNPKMIDDLIALDYDKKNYSIKPIHIASMMGDIETVKYIVGLDKNQAVSVSSYEDRSPIHFASFYGKTDVVKYLLLVGVGIDDKNKHFATPLILASINGHTELAKYLIDNGANIEARNRFDYTPLLWASANGHIEIVKYLLSKNADKTAKNKDGKNSCDLAKTDEIKKIVCN